MSAGSSHLHSVAWCLRLDDVARQVIASLDERGIGSILLKGPTVSRWLYAGPAERPYSDIDLLVDPASVDATTTVLRDLGFEAPVQTITGNRAPHAISWTRTTDGVSIDLHSHVEGSRLTADVLWARLQAGTEDFDLGRTTVRALNEPARTLVTALHVAQDGLQGNQAIRDLRRAIDVVPLPVWREAVALARDLDATGAMGAGLSLVADGRRLAAEIGLSSEMDVEAAIFSSSARDEELSFALGVDWLVSRRSVMAKAFYVVRKLFPPRAWMEERYTLPPNARLRLIAAYVKRWAWLARHLPAGVVVWWRARKYARAGRVG